MPYLRTRDTDDGSGIAPQHRAADRRARTVSIHEHHPDWEVLRSLLPQSMEKEAYYELMNKLKVATGQRISRMSCGQRSQVALGLILAQNPELLVLDDFSLGLDPGYRRLFVDYLRDYARSEARLSFWLRISFRIWERLVDDCIMMDYGKILIQKPIVELLEKDVATLHYSRRLWTSCVWWFYHPFCHAKPVGDLLLPATDRDRSKTEINVSALH